ncbi:hypothetical protein KP509_32G057200 [Ceratopteris richardii]|uniref:ARM repeat superfamily protein n=1 Tax=Ceratopteris richardii TaxID=49495 RepID=A0A8T2QU39_CERRI|nr:hypothetical protein KP509_32G057200 [Ceratopteris richardii]
MASEAAEPPVGSSPEQQEEIELFTSELSTTVDPSFIIHLIRQLLTSNVDHTLVKQPDQEHEAAPVRSPVDGGKERKEGAQQCDSEALFSSKASKDIEPCKHEGLQVHANSPSVLHQEGRTQVERAQLSLENNEALENGNIVKGSASSKDECSPSGSQAVCTMPDEQREEAGCMLWDLAATQSHAEFMVKHHVLEVLQTILGTPHSDRLREICLGILGNLACHAEPVKAIVETSGLPTEIIQTLFVDDAPSLSEACRLLSASLHSDQVDSWVKAIESPEVLERVIWIAANTMNSLLLEKSTELLLAMVDCQGSTTSILVSSLVKLGLPAVLTELLASELSAFKDGICSHGNVVLDTLLQIAEALSLCDEAAGKLAENSKLFALACEVIKVSGKEEVGPAGITATVLVANLLAEREDLVCDIFQDVHFVKQLLELLPSAADDPGARNAFWSILETLIFEITSNATGYTLSTEVSLVFAHGSRVLLEDLQEHQDIDDHRDVAASRGFTSKLETVSKVEYQAFNLLKMENVRIQS